MVQARPVAGYPEDQMVGQMEDHWVDLTEDRLAGRTVGQMEDRSVDLTGDHWEF